MSRRSRRAARAFLVAPVLYLFPAAGLATVRSAAAQDADPTYVPHRVYDAVAGTFTDFETLAARAARADVVVFGERHGDPGTHRLQRALLEGLDRRRDRLVVSLEMFDRDVQPSLDAYLAGRVDEGEFLAAARPWPRYASDYRPLVELARIRGWRVVAGNAPRAVASAVARDGEAALATVPAGLQALLPAEMMCPEDAYFEAFLEQMRRHPAPAPEPDTAERRPPEPRRPDPPAPDPPPEALPPELAERFYLAQCLRDETMAEAIVTARAAAGPDALVVHVTGGFHMAHGRGVVERVLRRDPGATLLTVLAVPTGDLDAIDVEPHRDQAALILFTLRPEPSDTLPDPGR